MEAVLRRPVCISLGLLATSLTFAPAHALAAGAAATPIDWSVTLRGQYSDDGSGGEYKAILDPELSASVGGRTAKTDYAVGGEVSVDQTGIASIDEAHAGAQSSAMLDEDTSLSQSLDLSLVQIPTDASGLPANTAKGPLEFTGTASAEVRHDFEPFYVSGSAGVTRFIEGPTTLDDASTVDNSDQSYWQANAGLRLGVEVTPFLSVFVDGKQAYRKYDAPDPTALAFLDDSTSTLQAGVAVASDDVFSAEASIGEAWHDYLDGTLSDGMTRVYNAKASFTPDSHLTFGSSVTTAIGPSSLIPGDTDVGTSLTANAAIKPTASITLRGSAGWDQVTTIETGDVANGYSAGAGIDFSSSPQAVWSADYLFAHSFTPPGPATDTQTVTLGLKVRN